MKSPLRIVILSHLSDAQFLMGCGKTDDADKHINFVKIILTDYGDINQMVEWSDLNDLWEKKINV